MLERSPEKYLPRIGGYCAFGMTEGQLFGIDPETGQVIDGKLYVDLNRSVLVDFNTDVNGSTEKADKNWPTVTQSAAA